MSKAIAKFNKDLDDSMLLGHMFFYRLPKELKMTEAELEKEIIDSGLDQKLIRGISVRDAFRRATSKMNNENIRIKVGTDYSGAKIEVDETKSDVDSVVRLIGRKIIDAQKEEADYEIVGRIELLSSGSVTRSINPTFKDEYDYDGILELAHTRFNEWSVYHTRDTIKNLMVRVVDSMQPINLLDTGLAKFIPITNKDVLYSLQEFGRAMAAYSPEESTFEIIPIIDTNEQRELIHTQAIAHITGEMDDLATQLGKLLNKNKTITIKQAARYGDKFKALRTKTQAYETIVDDRMDILQQQLSVMLDHVDDSIDAEN